MNRTKMLDLSEFVTEQDTKEFNKALMKMILKLQTENDILNERVAHLEKLLLSTDVFILGENK